MKLRQGQKNHRQTREITPVLIVWKPNKIIMAMADVSFQK